MGSPLIYDISLSNYNSGEGDVWKDEPTANGTIIYSVVTPIICFFGILGNGISLLVLRRRELNGSVFTYLAVLAIADLCTSILLLIGGLSKGALWWNGWATYDTLVSLPVGGFFNCLGVMATVGVTIDRVTFLWNPCQLKKPRMCRPKVARRIIVGFTFFCIVFNLPYCFIFNYDDDDTLVTSIFFDSEFYLYYNWMYMTIFVIIPSIVLIVGNGIIIRSVKKAKMMRKKCRSISSNKKFHGKETGISITLVSIIICFLISEVPANLVSRTSAVNILFQGDHSKANTKFMETLRQVCYLISATNVAVNFLLYYFFCPSFCKAMSKMLTIRKRKSKSTVQYNIFVINNGEMLHQHRRKHFHGGFLGDKFLEMTKRRNLFSRNYQTNESDYWNSRFTGSTRIDLANHFNFIKVI